MIFFYIQSALNPISLLTVLPQDRNSTIRSRDTLSFGSCVLQLSRSFTLFSSLAAHIEPVDAQIASPQGRGFNLSYILQK